MVPVFDVEVYLADCLDSILAQTYPDVEVVIVDDGSTDGSGDIAVEYAERHPGWKLLRTENHGLGAARNHGVHHASGEFLAFVDSDDLVPDDAYSLMISTLERSGSDFVVGSVQQLIGSDLVVPEFLRAGVSERRIGVRAGDVPPITRNVFAWNKVFRRGFYDRAEIAFPEGLRYEDQPAMMRAYLLAERFDIVRRPVYTWRVRESGTSITQGRARLSDLDDRLVTKQLTSAVVRAHAEPAVQEFWGRLGVVGDLPVYFEQLPHVDDVYWRRLVTGLGEVLDGLPPIEDSLLRLPQRLVGWLVLHDRRSDAEQVQTWVTANPGPLRLRVEHDHVTAPDLPVASDPAAELPDGVRRLGAHELVFDARLIAARWKGTTLEVTGWALIRGAPTAGVTTSIRAWLCPHHPGADPAGSPGSPGSPGSLPDAVVGVVSPFADPAATRWIDRGDQVYDDSGFVADFDLRTWLDRPRSERSELVVALAVEVSAVRGNGVLRSRVEDLDPGRLPSSPQATLTWLAGSGLVLAPR